MSEMTPAEAALAAAWYRELTAAGSVSTTIAEAAPRLVAAARPHIEAEVLSKATEIADAASRTWDGRTKAGFAAREVAREVAELWRDANYELRTRGGSDAG